MPVLNNDDLLRKALLSVQKPGRYIGGEAGCLADNIETASLKVALAFPDLYEIGMSNHAIAVLYDLFNKIDGLCCERVFAPAPDFEEVLAQNGLPLFSLESAWPISEFDILAFSVAYELGLTSLLSILQSSNIPLRREERGIDSPLVIAGGPGIVNPAPFSPFVDAVYIGEAEAVCPVLFSELVQIRKKGGNRQDLLERLAEEESFWLPGIKEKARRALYQSFGKDAFLPRYYALPCTRIVQEQGVVEVMRGCPNKCRFCQASSIYRPFRQKKASLIEDEVRFLVENCAYRKITLSSLSSGDYNHLLDLMLSLNTRYAQRSVSFALPSLRISGFSLGFLKDLSMVRKSGLTFAVEAGSEEGRLALNKYVGLGHLIDILRKAREMGWRSAKFYFMLGLPVPGGDSALSIIDFVNELRKAVRINLSLNLGTFIPKPFTPFQWAAQISPAEARAQISAVQQAFPKKFVKIGFHNPQMSLVEAFLSRGDARSGELALAAFKEGARLDPWDDYFKKEVWLKQISDFSDTDALLEEKSLDHEFPWDNIDMLINKANLKLEWKKSREGKETPACEKDCQNPCGACHDAEISLNTEQAFSPEVVAEKQTAPVNGHLILGFSKMGQAVYWSHLDLINMLERDLLRAEIPLAFSQGFNPKPRFSLAQPLSLGYQGRAELLQIYLTDKGNWPEILPHLNRLLPRGLNIHSYLYQPKGERKLPSLNATLWGACYEVQSRQVDLQAYFSTEQEEYIIIDLSDKKVCLQLPLTSGKFFKSILNEITEKNDDECLHVSREFFLERKSEGLPAPYSLIKL